MAGKLGDARLEIRVDVSGVSASMAHARKVAGAVDVELACRELEAVVNVEPRILGRIMVHNWARYPPADSAGTFADRIRLMATWACMGRSDWTEAH